MKIIADLHVHSHLSRATSRNSHLAGLYSWARIKGIHLIGTGDFTHPAWLDQLQNQLLPAEPGLLRLKEEAFLPFLEETMPEPIPVRFMLSSEISCIYKKGEKTRKIHLLLYVPDFQSARSIRARLAAIGNIEADGRPILGLDARNLLEILLESSPAGFMIPAHIWTPWFSLFGSKSGFDAIEACFEDLTPHIFALETGLSADPDMIRRISALDRFTLVSSSDCHSPAKLGREATLFDTDLDFFSIRDALRFPKNKGYGGTIEFFPEEGKYFFDGHRKCRICHDPEAAETTTTLCPVCAKPLTVGVMHRVLEMADRKTPYHAPGSPPFQSLVALPEILGNCLSVGAASKKVMTVYRSLVNRFGSELNVLREAPHEEIAACSFDRAGEAIRRLRNGQVIRKPGYDGEYGQIRLFDEGEI